MKNFNLKKFMKQAYYEDAKGTAFAQREWQNCYRKKTADGKMNSQEAWDSCLKEYQERNDKGDWASKYA